jgi:hypothetical protein
MSQFSVEYLHLIILIKKAYFENTSQGLWSFIPIGWHFILLKTNIYEQELQFQGQFDVIKFEFPAGGKTLCGFCTPT